MTGINTLTPYFKNKEVHSVSGHKTDESHSLYQKVFDEKKIEMGLSLVHAQLHCKKVEKPMAKQVRAELPPQPASLVLMAQTSNSTITTPQQQPAIMSPASIVIDEPKAKNAKNLIVAIPDPDQEPNFEEPKTPTLDISDTDIVIILEDCEQQTMALTQQVGNSTGSSIVSKQVVQQKNSPKIPIFQQLHYFWEHYSKYQ